MLKRAADMLFSLAGLILLFPVLLIIALIVIMDSGLPVFYCQKRVGWHGKDFTLFKFRTMKKGSEKSGSLTVGEKDSRITRAGYWLRKFKLDEFPQLINVLLGSMSLVGPRPELRKYVELYTPAQLKVLSVKPGITDYASIVYSNESALLASSVNPEEYYIHTILQEKLKLNLVYIEKTDLLTDLRIISQTLIKIWS